MFKNRYERLITQNPNGNEKYLFVVGYRDQAEQLLSKDYSVVYITPDEESFFQFDEFKERLQNGGFSYSYVYVLCLNHRNNQILENILTSKGVNTVTDGWKLFDTDGNLIPGKVAALIAARESTMVADQGEPKPHNTSYYIDNLMTGEIARFKNDKKTGFSNLDQQAGGLYSGLYVLAAISSLGKTSFALQLADQLAESGNDVIFFSMEQSRLELVSKSIARRTTQRGNAVSSLSIRKGYLPSQVLAAAQDYKKSVSDRVSIIEGNFSCNVQYISNYVSQYIERNNCRPVVFIDYLQILQPIDDRRQSTKEVMDRTVTELSHMSRELDLTVIVISSVNRANYLTPIDFESLKESGGIEFTADVIWGLQLQCLNEELFDKDKHVKEKRERVKAAKAESPRKIELVCLKNRYGKSSYSCYYEYFPENDLFVEQKNSSIYTPPKAGRKL